jgi:hypothetical protein
LVGDEADEVDGLVGEDGVGIGDDTAIERLAEFLRAGLVGVVEGGDPDGLGTLKGVGLQTEEVTATEYCDGMGVHGDY